MMNLLNYLEIFINELRKFEIACGNELFNSTESGPIPMINLRMARKQAVQTMLQQKQEEYESQIGIGNKSKFIPAQLLQQQ